MQTSTDNEVQVRSFVPRELNRSNGGEESEVWPCFFVSSGLLIMITPNNQIISRFTTHGAADTDLEREQLNPLKNEHAKKPSSNTYTYTHAHPHMLQPFWRFPVI